MSKKMPYVLISLLVSTLSFESYLTAQPAEEVVNTSTAILAGNQSDEHGYGDYICDWITQWLNFQNQTHNQTENASDQDAVPHLYILDGGPGGGKTSILQYLNNESGYYFLEEAATSTYLDRKARGIEPPQEPLKDFHEEIIDLHNFRFGEVMEKAKGTKRVFADRSPIGIWGYKEANGFDEPSNLASTCDLIMSNPNICKTVFIVDLVPEEIVLRNDNNESRKDVHIARKIHYAILNAYLSKYGKTYIDENGKIQERPNGFNVVIVPIHSSSEITEEVSIKERAEFILHYIEEHKL
jgi:predicted ATPase